MRSINILTINGEPENAFDLIKIVEDAKSCFPKKTWEAIRYLGEIALKHDVTIEADGESFGAFLFKELTKRIGKIRHRHRLKNLLLGITPDPIVAMNYFFEGGRFRRTLYLVHDYVAERFGVVSLFRVIEESSSKLVAHGLGHNRGLRHHLNPIDLMYSELLSTPTLEVEGFCKVCLNKLEKDSSDTL